MKRIFASLALILLIAAGIWFAVQRTAKPGADTNKLQVVTSFYPLYDFAKHIGGNVVQVTNITPAGSEPHDYEPAPQALVAAQKSAVFIYNGGTFEPWTAGFLADFKHTAVKASQNVNLQMRSDEAGTQNTVQDPHFWLDPVLAQQIVMNIRDGLAQADPTHNELYTKNAAAYIEQLVALDRAYQAGLASCSVRTIVTSHEAFGYISQRYNLTTVAIAGISPEEEPSAGKLAELTQLVKDKQLHYIFFESLVSPRLADTIALETGAKTLVFDPIEGLSDEAQKQGKDYLSVQRDNLVSLRTALACR